MHKGFSLSKQINQQRILDLLRSEMPLSRADIARMTGLSKATVSRLVLELEQAGAVRPNGSDDRILGRKSRLYNFNNDMQCVAGIELHHEALHAIVTNFEAKPLKEYSLRLPNTSINTFMDVFGDILKRINKDIRINMVGVSIGIQGICDNQSGMVVQAANLGWYNVPLNNLILERYGIKVDIVNRANAAALGEYWYGAGKEAKSLFYIHIGSGIGAGLVYEGELILGASNAAGEFGHVPVLINGPRCRCGNRGCLEAIASANAIVGKIKTLAPGICDKELEDFAGKSLSNFSAVDVVAAALAGNKLVMSVLDETAEYIGIALGSVLNVFNPECIVVGGLSYYLPLSFINRIQEETNKYSLPYISEDVKFIRSELGQNAVAIGAAALLVNNILPSLHQQTLI